MTNKENKQKLSISIETETLDRIRELTRVLNSRELDKHQKLSSLSILVERLINAGYEVEKEGIYYEAS